MERNPVDRTPLQRFLISQGLSYEAGANLCRMHHLKANPGARPLSLGYALMGLIARGQVAPRLATAKALVAWSRSMGGTLALGDLLDLSIPDADPRRPVNP